MVLWETQECTGLSGIRNITRYVARRKDRTSMAKERNKSSTPRPRPAPQESRGEAELLDLKRLGKTSNRRWNFELDKPYEKRRVTACDMRIAINLSLFFT